MDHTAMTRRTLLAAGGAGALTALAACAPASGAPSGGTDGKVRLTYGNISVPKIRGELERTLKKKGITVEWVGPFPNHAPTLQAVATDTADFSFGGSSTPADQAILSGADLVYVAWAATRPRTTAILAGRNSGVEKVADLAGKSVAVNKAGLGEFLLVAALEKYHVPREKVTVLYMNPPEAASAFASGKIAAWSIWEGFRETAEVKYGAKPIFVESEELDRQVDFRTYLVRRAYAEKHPDTVRAVVDALIADQEWQNDHYRRSLELGNQVSRYPKAVIDRMASRKVRQELSPMNDDGVAQLQYGADWLSQRKIISAKIDIGEHAVRV